LLECEEDAAIKTTKNCEFEDYSSFEYPELRGVSAIRSNMKICIDILPDLLLEVLVMLPVRLRGGDFSNIW